MSQVEHHQTGLAYWRSLEQLADTPQVRALMEQEFPGYDASSIATSSRRKFLKIMGAALALSGLTLTGCRRWPKEKLVPHTVPPQGHVPGELEQYATVWEQGGVAHPLLVTSFDGRPIKIEGNPTHPFSWTIKDKMGSADAFAQASVLEMYDPQRSRYVVDRRNGAVKETKWEAFAAFAKTHFAGLKSNSGTFAILSESSSSPSVLDMKKRLLAAFPQAKWYEYEPVSRDNENEGSRLAFGKAVRTRLSLDKAKVVVSLDADLLGTHPAHVRYAADWAQRRRSGDEGEMIRVYMAESGFSVTGTVADVRVAVDPSRLYAIAAAIAGGVGVSGAAADKLSDVEKKFVDSAIADLKKAGGDAIVTAGPAAAPVVHALAHAINAKLGAVGKTVTLLEDPAGDQPTHVASITALTKAIDAGQVQTLLILGGNPAFDAPVDLAFDKALAKVANSIHLALHDDETSRLCKWHLPRAHYLESWGDARAWDGSAGVTQPLIEPLFGGKSTIELLAMLSGDEVATGEAIVRRTWKDQFIRTGDFEREFRRALEAGLLFNTGYMAVTPAITATAFPAPAASKGFYIRFQADSHVYDGRFANNGWLQETHDPITKLVWDNAAIISVADAKQLNLDYGDIIKIEVGGRWMEIAAFPQPGQPVGVITLPLGYGRTAAGSVGDKLGFNTYSIRSSTAPYVASDAKVTKTGQKYTLATTQHHDLIDEVGMKGREDRVGKKGETGLIVREATLNEYKHDHAAPHKKEGHLSSLQLFNGVSDKMRDPHAWGMAVDLNTCIGCNACVVACYAENNIPIVGKDQVLMHRQMNWIRIDRYFKGAPEDTSVEVVHQPMMCVHCENAPCEQVCPVAATVHDTEGLNTMVYNRCIGTRYCSNNCPYKVRRFNYFDYHAKDPRTGAGEPWVGMPDSQQRDQVDPVKAMVFNPDVTVRMRGVMEKCTYCTQRLSRAKIAKRNAANAAGKPELSMLLDGEVMTACQQACPTQAIVFGNLNDKNARVTQLHQKNHRAYDVLGELNTRPRTRYLAKLRNPAEASTATKDHG